MLEGQFYLRLFLIAVFGTLLVYTLIKQGGKSSIEVTSQKHITQKIFATLCAIIALGSFIVGVVLLYNINFPNTMLEKPLGANSIIRSSNVEMIWGFKTQTQTMVITLITHAFFFLGLAGYFFCFKSSDSKKGKKALKVIYIVLLYVLFVNSTEFQYFDLYEFFPLIIFSGLAFLCYKVANKNQGETIIIEKADNSSTEATNQNDDETTKLEDFQSKAVINTLTKKEIIEIVGKDFFLNGSKVLADKLIYISGISGFDEYLGKNNQFSIGAVIHIEEKPKGIILRLAKLFSNKETAISYNELNQISLVRFDRYSVLLLNTNQGTISFGLENKNTSEVNTFFKSLNKVSFTDTKKIEIPNSIKDKLKAILLTKNKNIFK